MRDTVAAINAGRVPDALQEELLGQANEVAARIACPGPSEPQAAAAARELAEWARERAG